MSEKPKIVSVFSVGKNANELDTVSLNLTNNKYGMPATRIILETGVSGCTIKPRNKALLLNSEVGSYRLLAVACLNCVLACSIKANLQHTYPYIT